MFESCGCCRTSRAADVRVLATAVCSEDVVVLVSNDGERFEVPKREAQMSELVMTVTEDEGA